MLTVISSRLAGFLANVFLEGKRYFDHSICLGDKQNRYVEALRDYKDKNSLAFILE